MRQIFIIAYMALATLSFAGCSRELWTYEAPLSILFDGIDESCIHLLEDGEKSYNMTGQVTSSEDIAQLDIYMADYKTSLEYGDPLYSEQFQEGTRSVKFSYTLTNIEASTSLKVVASTYNGKIFKKGIVLKITPQVIYTEKGYLESYDYLYGTFYADWYDGRTYTMRNAGEFAEAIDISSGEVAGALCLVSPASRNKFDLPVYSGAKETNFAMTELTKNEFDAISQTDASSLTALSPDQEYVKIEKGRVYSCATQDGRKGLIYISDITHRQDINFPDKTIYTITISTKISVRK